MKLTNGAIQAKIQFLDIYLRQMELTSANDRATALALERIEEEREVLNLVLLNRRVEAARPVVDFKRWRTANGALDLLAANDAAPGEQRRTA
jgi:hypothetical protein